jgi:hypothetical protein
MQRGKPGPRRSLVKYCVVLLALEARWAHLMALRKAHLPMCQVVCVAFSPIHESHIHDRKACLYSENAVTDRMSSNGSGTVDNHGICKL